jgi:hypothetical protein
VTRIPQLEEELVAAAERLHSPRRLVRPALRAVLVLGAVAVVILLAVVVAAENDRRPQPPSTRPVEPSARLAEDLEAGVRFELDGRVLTVHLLASAPGETRRRVSGERVRAMCGKGLTEGPGPAPGRPDTIQQATRGWPAGSTRGRFPFPGDISAIATWCRLENPAVGHIAFARFDAASTPASIAAQRKIARTADKWARLFVLSDLADCKLMTQPACERLSCIHVGPEPIPGCTPPSPAYRLSFARARVVDVETKGDRAAARFSNGEVVELVDVDGHDAGGVWWVHKFGPNAGRGFFR